MTTQRDAGSIPIKLTIALLPLLTAAKKVRIETLVATFILAVASIIATFAVHSKVTA